MEEENGKKYIYIYVGGMEFRGVSEVTLFIGIEMGRDKRQM